jgi:endonuclease G, mitochondrial
MWQAIMVAATINLKTISGTSKKCATAMVPQWTLKKRKERVKMRIAREGSYQLALERIMGSTDYQEVYILDILFRLSKSVCRIKKNGRAIGTGFLVAENILITNHHVLPNDYEAEEVTAEFDFEIGPPPLRELLSSSEFECEPEAFFFTSPLDDIPGDPYSGLDFTLVALKPNGTNGKSIKDYTPVALDGNKGKIIKGENCVIIQHPEGKPKKVALKNSAFFSETTTRIIYETDTQPGSSGSMVVALGTGEVVALHHAGLPRTDDQNRILTKTGAIATNQTPEQDIAWIGNQGIKVSKIVEAIEGAVLPEHMEQGRNLLISKTKKVSKELQATDVMKNDALPVANAKPPKETKPAQPKENAAIISGVSSTNAVSETADFLLTAEYTEQNLNVLQSILIAKYGAQITLSLSMPAAAVYGEPELFFLQIPDCSNPQEVLSALRVMPGVINVEWDRPIQLNADRGLAKRSATRAAESIGMEESFSMEDTNGFVYTESFLADDGFGTPNENTILEKYTVNQKSKYFKEVITPADALANREWNWRATGFDKAIKDAGIISPAQAGIKMVQFDTGYSEHNKVWGGFNTDNDADFVGDDDTPNDARDSETTGILKMPGHGTRTGSLLIGRKEAAIPENGNPGLVEDNGKFKLTPYRIAKSVILINRQQELAAALNRAILQGFEIITMSMGLPPTLATARMAKLAYDKGIIWCAAAGNEVKFVIAPAVYPGTIAVAASNPLDKLWKGSSRGSTVDITAPGEDVYVPIVFKDAADGNNIKEGFSYGNGTSYATPHIAAAAAYWLAKYKDELNKPAYAGWRKVEAFRKALKQTARKKHNIDGKGYGAGILDADALMKQKPQPPADKDYAYNGWNEHAFFAKLQGIGEIGKTYWNELHGWLFGKKRKTTESFVSVASELSEDDRLLEAALFGGGLSATESSAQLSQEELNRRLAMLNQSLFND